EDGIRYFHVTGVQTCALPISDVLPHRHMLVDGGVLEHHRDVALLRFALVHDLAAYPEHACGNVLKARDHAQRRRLAAAGGANENHEFAVLDVQIDSLYRGHSAVILRETFEFRSEERRVGQGAGTPG